MDATPKDLLVRVYSGYAPNEMPKSLHSSPIVRGTLRSISAPSMFGAFPAELREQLVRLAIVRKYSDGQIIQHRGDDPTGFYLINAGQIKLGRFDADGHFRTAVILGSGDSYGELAVLGSFPRVVDAVAMGEVTASWISGKEMDRILRQNPDSMRQLLRVIATQLQEALDVILQQRRMSTPRRIARILGSMCGGQDAPVQIAIKQEDLAELVGTSRMTVAKALAGMERQGIIKRGYGNLQITDIAALARY